MSSRLLFSASSVLGSRPGSVGVGVRGCPGCAWVWRGAAPLSLAIALPAGVSAGSVAAAAGAVARRPFVRSVSVRRHRGRVFLRVRGCRSGLLAVAVWWGFPQPVYPAYLTGGWREFHGWLARGY